MESDIPLLEDRNLLHSDKDIELICGSLLAFRKGTLQVIHLTVKEFLMATDGPKNPLHAELLVEPRQASMKLTHMCLKYLEINCVHPILNVKNETARMDFQILPPIVESLRDELPLAEYACFSWLAHLIECERKQVQGIAKIFWQAFSNPATFHWCELCMTFQPESVERLLIGMDELNDWILTAKPEYWHERDASCQFLSAWCLALRTLFEDFGPVLSRRPWEIHFLDLRMVFSDLEDFYQNNSHMAKRDTNVSLEESKLGSPPGLFQSEPRVQLRQGVESGAFRSDEIFFLHDEAHDLYFWGQRGTSLLNLTLNVQHSVTGQRLPPSIGIVEGDNENALVECCTMSSDGQFIALVFHVSSAREDDTSLKSNDSSQRGPLTIIWKISENLDFSRRMISESWARVIYSHFSDPETLTPTSKGIAFVDGYCFTPNSRFDLSRCDVLPFLTEPMGQRDNDTFGLYDYFFDGNGNIYFSQESSTAGLQVKMFSPVELNAPNLYAWDQPKWRLHDVSTYGR